MTRRTPYNSGDLGPLSTKIRRSACLVTIPKADGRLTPHKTTFIYYRNASNISTAGRIERSEMGARWTKPRLKAYAINFLISLIVGYFFGFLAFAGTLFALELIGVVVAVATGKNP